LLPFEISIMDWLIRIVLRKLISRVTARGSTFRVGDGVGKSAAIRFVTRAAERQVLLDPELRFGEAYVDGKVIVERGSIADVLAIVLGHLAIGSPLLGASPMGSFDTFAAAFSNSTRRVAPGATLRTITILMRDSIDYSRRRAPI